MIIEEVIRNYLTAELEYPVYADIPADPPDEFIAIDKTGGSQRNFLSSATIAIQSHAKSRYKAASINESVKSAMQDIVILKEIAGCHLSGDYNFTNTATKWNRYQAVFDITHY